MRPYSKIKTSAAHLRMNQVYDPSGDTAKTEVSYRDFQQSFGLVAGSDIAR